VHALQRLLPALTRGEKEYLLRVVRRTSAGRV